MRRRPVYKVQLCRWCRRPFQPRSGHHWFHSDRCRRADLAYRASLADAVEVAV